jgi:hypothetical protein
MNSDWTAEVAASTSHYNVTYTNSARQLVDLAIEVPNPPPPTERGAGRTLAFRGDANAEYQVDDTTDPASSRWLLWDEPGSWAGDPAIAGSQRPHDVPYFLRTERVTEPQFWAIANSLEAVGNHVVTPVDSVAALAQLVGGLPAEHAATGSISTPDGAVAAVEPPWV